MATLLERQFEKMTPEQRKKAVKAISAQMGMPQKPKKTAKKTKKK